MNFLEFQKKRRKELMPSGDKLAKIAQEKYCFTASQVKTDFNSCLRKLLDIEFSIYQEKEKEC